MGSGKRRSQRDFTLGGAELITSKLPMTESLIEIQAIPSF